LIINIVYYTGEKPYKNSTDFKDLLDAPKDIIDAFWAKPFLLIEAQNMDDRALMRQRWSGLFAYATKYIKARDLLCHAHNLLQLMKGIEEKDGVDYITAIVNYTVSTGEFSDIAYYLQLLNEGLSEKTRENIMTGAEQLIEIGKQQGMQEGIQKGVQKGMQQGAIEGEKILLKRLLAKRFGVVPSYFLAQLENAGAELLLEWGDKLIDAKTLHEVFETRH
jgi:hypothetical protein